MSPPLNLQLHRFLLLPAELPGAVRFWAVYERLDAGEVLHSRYCGLLTAEPGEGVDSLYERAQALAGAEI